jgi:outer membrane protein OmpA-like peptidoglycan-associated protein
MPLLGWLAWSTLEGFQSSRVRSVAQRVVETSTEVKGYPITVDVEPWGKALTVSGLTPTDAAREDVVKRLTDLLPDVQVRDQLSVVPTTADARPQLALVRSELARLQADTMRASLRRTMDRTRLRLDQAQSDLAALAGSTKEPAAMAAIERARHHASQTVTELLSLHQRLGALQGRRTDLAPVKEQLETLSRRLAGSSVEIAGVIAGAGKMAEPAPLVPKGTVADAAEELAAQAERLAAVAIAVYQADILNRRPPPTPVVVAPSPPTPRERVDAWARANAVFFANGADYRNQQRSAATLDDLAQLLKETRLVVHVVGFTDDQGSAALNAPIALARAEKVVADLVARGVAANKLVAVGRGQGYDVSPVKGPQSPNRRVEIHAAFEGEGAE